MLSKNLKRVLIDSRWSLPPTFLLPWTASLTTVTHAPDAIEGPPPPSLSRKGSSRPTPNAQSPSTIATAPRSERIQDAPKPLPPPASNTNPIALSPSIQELLPLLKAQSSHYITVHLHGKPYLLTQGDTVRLPFFMHGVQPGDILRLNRAVNIGSRDYTWKAAAAAPTPKSVTAHTRNILDPTTGVWETESQGRPRSEADSEVTPMMGSLQHAPHFIPHIEQGKHNYLDERLFVCRAVVMGVESEPLRIKEKTKRRQRKIKKVKSKHRFTLLRVKELRIRDVEELENGE